MRSVSIKRGAGFAALLWCCFDSQLSECDGLLREQGFCRCECVAFSDVYELELFVGMADDFNLVANVEVEIYDGEFFGVVAHEWEQCGRECVDARKCKASALFYVEIGVGRFDGSGSNVCPSYEAVVFVAKQVARGCALRHEEHGCMSASALIEFLEVRIAQDVNVVDKDGFVGGK